ncbi:MAG: hypothetical protein PHT52_08165 [Eubacteriales bacterium]|nr:hypothetical protein [Eubacteriales bacterium]MDD4769756.1 hypothetical protein [Eubacteriales bacterium]
MNFFMLVFFSSLICIIAVSLAVLVPRWLFSGKLRKQLKQAQGHKFTPDKATWRGYLAKTAPMRPLISLFIYAVLLALLFAFDAGTPVMVAGVTLGVYLLLHQLLCLLPPTYGITGKGVTVLSWLPAFPLGFFGAGSIFIPWQAVEICAIDQLFIVVLTQKIEARLVFPPEIEEQVCAFVDSLLRRRGYRTN